MAPISTALRAAAIALALCLFAEVALAAKPHFRRIDRNIEAPIETVWTVLGDLDQWRRFTPGLVTLSIEESTPDAVTCRFEVERVGVSIAYSARIRFDRAAGEVHIALDQDAEHDIETLRTTWTLAPGADGRSTEISLASHFRSGMPVPGFIERRALRSSLEDTVEALATIIADLPAEYVAPVRIAAID